MTISQRLDNENKRLYTPFHIIQGHGFYIEDGKPYTRQEFEEKYPVVLRARDQEKDNADRTKEWMYY